MPESDFAELSMRTTALEVKVAVVETKLDENTRDTKEIKAMVSEAVEFLNAMKGFMKVVNGIASLARPLGAIILFFTAIAGFWTAIRGMIK